MRNIRVSVQRLAIKPSLLEKPKAANERESQESDCPPKFNGEE
jgi:hypothetical protein